METNVKATDHCTKDSLLDTYAKRINFKSEFPSIMNVNLIDFVSNYALKKGNLVKQSCKVVPQVFPTCSSNPRGDNYSLFCKYQLLTYKPWKDSQHNAWGTESPQDSTYINAWQEFLKLPYAKQHISNWTEKLQNVIDNIEFCMDEQAQYEHQPQEDWMMQKV